MRRLSSLIAGLGLFVALSLPAFASSGSGPAPVPTCHPTITLPDGTVIPSTGPCTETDHFSDLTFLANPLACPAGSPFSGWAIATFTGNGIQHVTVNAKGDSWFTTTFTGTGSFTPILMPDFSTTPPTITLDPTQPTLVGHLTMWFGFESNAKNFVAHDTAHFIGVTQAPFPVQKVDVHFADHFSSTGNNPFVPHTVVMHISCV
jgi:hypothetical protein